MLQGGAPLRTAIYLPAGWIPLALAVGLVLAGRQRQAIRAFARR